MAIVRQDSPEDLFPDGDIPPSTDWILQRIRQLENQHAALMEQVHERVGWATPDFQHIAYLRRLLEELEQGHNSPDEVAAVKALLKQQEDELAADLQGAAQADHGANAITGAIRYWRAYLNACDYLLNLRQYERERLYELILDLIEETKANSHSRQSGEVQKLRGRVIAAEAPTKNALHSTNPVNVVAHVIRFFNDVIPLAAQVNGALKEVLLQHRHLIEPFIPLLPHVQWPL